MKRRLIVHFKDGNTMEFINPINADVQDNVLAVTCENTRYLINFDEVLYTEGIGEE